MSLEDKMLDLDELEYVNGGVSEPKYHGKPCKAITLKPDETPLNVAVRNCVDIDVFKKLNQHIDLYKPASGAIVYIPA